MILLDVQESWQALRSRTGPGRGDVRGAAGRTDRVGRPQRQRQDDPAAHPRRQGGAPTAAPSACTPRSTPATSNSSRAGSRAARSGTKPSRRLADLIALQDEALSVAEAMADDADPAEHKQLAAPLRSPPARDPTPRRLQPRKQDQRVLDGLRFRPESLDPAGRIPQRRRAKPPHAGQAAAGRAELACSSTSRRTTSTSRPPNGSRIFSSKVPRRLLVVSHDRYFLDKVTTRTLELFRGTVDSYPGNFSAYCQQKAERLLVEQRHL